MPRLLIIAVLAGVAGAVANAIAAVVVAGPDKWALLAVPARYAVACAIALLLPFIFRALPRWGAVLTALATLTLLPSMNAKLVIGVGAPWNSVLTLNGVYAVVATLVFLIAAGPGATQPRQRL